MILLIHPLHGRKHAYAESEALADEKNGWVRQVDKPAEEVKKPEEKPAQEVFRNKPGPKPKAK